MAYSGYLKALDQIVSTGVKCRCCGYVLFAFSAAQSGFCSFCEAYSNDTYMSINKNIELKDKIIAMSDALSRKSWLEGAKLADELVATGDPSALYGAANFYAAFSDSVYHDVDYTLGGFMYDNASRRSDEPKKNRYNAMGLASKSREYFYKAIKVIGDSKTADPSLLFIVFMANIKLKRNAHAGLALQLLKKDNTAGAIPDYADMVMLELGRHPRALRQIEKMADSGNINAFYYLAHHAAMRKDFNTAKAILSKLSDNTTMLMADELIGRITDVQMAMG